MCRSRARRRGPDVRIVSKTVSAFGLVDAVYLMTILANRPRSIDRYIDYFGSAAGLDPRDEAGGTLQGALIGLPHDSY